MVWCVVCKWAVERQEREKRNLDKLNLCLSVHISSKQRLGEVSSRKGKKGVRVRLLKSRCVAIGEAKETRSGQQVIN